MIYQERYVKHSVHHAGRINMKQIRQLLAHGKRGVFPDIIHFEEIMLSEISSASEN